MLLPGSLDIELQGHCLTLLPQRALWWGAESALVLSDLHAGKAAHFRKAGMPMPKAVFEEDLARLDGLLQRLSPQRIIITGDLFHSAHNREVDDFGQWLGRYPATRFTLVRGNHDILKQERYAAFGLEVMPELLVGRLRFRHEPPPPTTRTQSIPPNANYLNYTDYPNDFYLITGHLHPGIALDGAGRQRLKLPCFHLTPTYAVLPAFSRLTGLALVRPHPGDRVFGIVGEENVMPIFGK